MPHRHRALLLAELALAAAIGTTGTGCQTSSLTATGWNALQTARAGAATEGPALELQPVSDQEPVVQPPPTARSVNPIPQRYSEAPQYSTAPVIGPQTTLAWTVESGGQDPPFSGQNVVDPSGQVNLGPYGSVAVGGMSPQQASQAIARHLARWIHQPRVRLTVSLRRSAEPSSPYPTVMQHPQGSPRTASSVQRVNHFTPPQEMVMPPSRPPVAQEGTGMAMTIAATQGQLPLDAVGADGDKDKKNDDKTEEAPQPNRVPTGTTGYPVPPVSHLSQVPTEMKKVTLPPYVIEPPDILIVEAVKALPDQDIRGQHAVRPDGTIGLGIYGSVYVAGKTLDQARDAIVQHLQPRLEKLKPEDVYVDVLAYNSKVYYVITDGGGYGEQVYRIPITGSETVLDALGQTGGLPPVASKKRIWVARRSDHGMQQTLPVDWVGITQHGDATTNYQIMPGDRVYVHSNKLVTIDTFVSRVLSPIERIMGATLLGSQTVNSIKGQGVGGGGAGR